MYVITIIIPAVIAMFTDVTAIISQFSQLESVIEQLQISINQI